MMEQMLELYAAQNGVVEVVYNKDIPDKYGYKWRVWLTGNENPGFGHTLWEAYHEAERNLEPEARLTFDA